MPKWQPDLDRYRVGQLSGRPRYHLPKDLEVLRATIGKLIKGHERLRSKIQVS